MPRLGYAWDDGESAVPWGSVGRGLLGGGDFLAGRLGGCCTRADYITKTTDDLGDLGARAVGRAVGAATTPLLVLAGAVALLVLAR